MEEVDEKVEVAVDERQTDELEAKVEETSEKKPGFFKRLEKSKKGQILFFLVSMLVVLYLFNFINNNIKQHFETVKDDYSWVYQVEQVRVERGKLLFSGWAFKEGYETKKADYTLILQDTESEERFFPWISYEERIDVNKYFEDEVDYTSCGFSAQININQLDTNRVYEIVLKPKGEKTGILTGIYYYNEELLMVHPDKFIPVQSNSKKLNELITKARLCLYAPEIKMYVYQYKDEIYWIAENGNDMFTQFLMFTNQYERVPEESKKVEANWTNASFMFSSRELVDLGTEKYRVAKCALTEEHSITKVQTGIEVDGERNRVYFRPWYDFE